MDPEELKKLSTTPDEDSPTDVVDKLLAKTLPLPEKKKVVLKPKKLSTQDFAKKASEMEQDHIDDIKSALTPMLNTGGFSVSKVIESIAQRGKPSEDVAQGHLKEMGMSVAEEEKEEKKNTGEKMAV